jgi:mono/diheme cytochrome c family protein
MNKWVRRGAVTLTVLVAAASAAFVTLVALGDRKLERRVEVAVAPLAVHSGAASVERGRYLFASRGCGECHGADGRGHVVIDDGSMLVRAPDISPAPQSVVARYADADWVRTIRHGVKPDGRPVIIMPSEDYNRLVDADVASIIAFARQLPPATGAKGDVRLPLLVKALYAAGIVRDASEKIDHSLPPAQPVAEGVTPAHGAYVANGCIGCHGKTLAGGTIPGAPPDWPPASKLTPGPGSALERYPTAEEFMAMLKTGRRPDGTSVSKVMPFVTLKEMSEVDARALHLHLRSLPPGSS